MVNKASTAANEQEIENSEVAKNRNVPKCPINNFADCIGNECAWQMSYDNTPVCAIPLATLISAKSRKDY